MGTNIYMSVLAVAFATAILAGTYHLLAPWLVWLLGIALALLVGVVALVILGQRILRGDFDRGRSARESSLAPGSRRADD